MKHVIPVALTGLALAACGGGTADRAGGSRPSQQELQEAQLEFARCMRKHGIDFPDPKPGGGAGVKFVGPAPGTPPSALRSGEKECGKILAKIRPPEISAERQREFVDQALRFARCMRRNGIDMPDPRVDGRRVALTLPRGLHPDGPRMRKATQACRRHQPRPPGG